MCAKMNIPFSPPDISDVEINEVVNALRSGWITTGPRVKAFEKRIAERVGAGFSESGTPRCVCLNSQTACAEMALHLLGIGSVSGGSAEDEVIVPAYTYTASASVVCHVGAKPVLIDCGKDSLEWDYDALENAITERTKAIIPVDLGGVPCDYDRIFSIVEKKKNIFKPCGKMQQALGRIAVSADAAHAFGASYKGKPIGSVADFTSFSFHAVKNLTTGEGGALCWKKIEGVCDDETYRKLQLLSLHGQSKDALAKTKIGAWEYDVVGPWYKCNMTDVIAAIGLGQLDRYDGMLERRKQIISRYNAAFKPLGVEPLCHYTADKTSSGHLYIARMFYKDGTPVSDGVRREVIIEMAERGIACNVHYKPLPMHTAYKALGFDIKNYPNAFSRYENEITLPLHTLLTDEEVDYIIENFTEILKGLKG